MNLAETELKRPEDNTRTHKDSVLLRCRSASELIYNGQYEAAKDALGEFWRGVGSRPDLRGLDISVSAEVLLQCGVLSGWLGSAGQVTDSQEKSKDLIFESLRLFQSNNQSEKVSEAQYELGMCYWREGAFDESRVVLQEALKGTNSEELKAKILIRRTLAEGSIGCYHDAFNTLKEAALFLESCDDAIKGRWHGQMGLVLRRFGSIEGQTDYFDRAVIEYTAAIYHYEQIGHERYCGTNLNNLAFLYYKLGHYKEAHETLEGAARIFRKLNDPGYLAQVEETKARVLLAEGCLNKADFLISNVIRKLEKGGESALLADALAIQGIVWSKLQRIDRSICKLRDAIDTATYAGALHNAGLATLALIEEHGAENLTEEELYDFYCDADKFLKDTQDFEEISRLRQCAKIVTERLHKAQSNQPKEINQTTSLTDALHSFEAKMIEEALQVEDGSVSRAAKRLGIKHQSLAHLLNTRHNDLLTQRTQIVKRKRSLIKLSSPKITAHCVANSQARVISILHVEDSPQVANLVKLMLISEGWKVETCADGNIALQLLESEMHYDIILLDNDLPKVTGLELARRARKMPHRQQTPIILFSANLNEQEALNAGANLALKKPEDIEGLVSKIKPLVKEKKNYN